MNFMSKQEIKDVAPAVFADRALARMSSKYGHVNSEKAIDIFAEEGFRVVKATQDRHVSRDINYMRHMLTFRHEDQDEPVVGGVAPQILMINSHNGKSALTLRMGLYRFVCSNGLVIGNDQFHTKLRHSVPAAAMILEHIGQMAARTTEAIKKIEDWGKIDLSTARAQTFAEEAALLRFGEAKAKIYPVEELLMVRRPEDDKGDLWTVYNRVQENTVHLSMAGKTELGRHTSSRPLNGISGNIIYNERLWDLAESFAE